MQSIKYRARRSVIACFCSLGDIVYISLIDKVVVESTVLLPQVAAQACSRILQNATESNVDNFLIKGKCVS